jgi:hypothetical protein
MHCATSLSGPLQPVQQPLFVHPLSRIPTRRQLIIAIIGSNLFATIVAAILGVYIPQYLDARNQHPSDIIVTHLMEQEARASQTHDLGLVRSIYDPHAVVADASCASNHADIKQGIAEIINRYQNLPTFLSLYHVNVAVSWDPDSSQAIRATASADTIGEILQIDNTRLFISGHEQWTFARSGDHWLITSFTYNLCLPSKP